ncbi:hypothetical protein CRENBAI_013147, partial [Crenichthys baileyi]
MFKWLPTGVRQVSCVFQLMALGHGGSPGLGLIVPPFFSSVGDILVRWSRPPPPPPAEGELGFPQLPGRGARWGSIADII